MKHGHKTVVCLVGGLALLGQVGARAADSEDNPYSDTIVTRNIFSLKPPPALPAVTEPVKPPPPKLWLTGITTILGNKRALLKGNFAAKAGEPAKDQSFMLCVGEREGEIEVIEIDEKKGIVTVDDFGQVINLTFESAPKPPAPGTPPAPGAAPAAPAATGRPPLPIVRPIRPTSTPVSPAPAPAETSTTAPAVSSATAPAIPAPRPPTPDFIQVSPEEQIITMEVLREQHQNDPEFPPFPPTILTPGYDPETGEVNTPIAEPPAMAPSPAPQPTMPSLPMPGRPPGMPMPGMPTPF
jgi:hypothetical protein